MKEDQKNKKETADLQHLSNGVNFQAKEIDFDENSPALQKKKTEAQALLKSNQLQKK